jgi:hypothetical protein
MSAKERAVTRYRDHSILINPSGKLEDAFNDAFAIYEPGAHPMNTLWIHEHPGTVDKIYSTEDEARDAALTLARAWIDAHLARPTE